MRRLLRGLSGLVGSEKVVVVVVEIRILKNL